MSDFFNRLDLLRQNKSESIIDIAHYLGISGPAVHGWKKGGLPKPDKLRLLAKHYGVTVEWLLTGVEDKSSIRSTPPVSGCPHCAEKDARIATLERKLDQANESVNNLTRVLAQGRAPAVPAAGAVDVNHKERRGE